MNALSSDKIVVPHIGVGEIRFGMDRDGVRAILGDPAEVDAESVPDWESWSYPDLGLEITFDADEEYRCTYLQVSHADYQVGGTTMLGLERAALVKSTSGLDLGEGVDSEEDGGDESLEFPDVSLEIHFDAGRSVMLGWSAEIDETDEFRFPNQG